MRRSPGLIVGLLVGSLLATIFLQFRNASELGRISTLLRNNAAAQSDEVAALRSELDQMRSRNVVFRDESESLRRQLAGGTPPLASIRRRCGGPGIQRW